MSEIEPRCREARRLLGLPYPKSSCDICGSLIQPNWRCRWRQSVRPAPATSNHGRVRMNGDEMGITLGGIEHGMSVEEALALANRIIFTAVDKETRYAE